MKTYGTSISIRVSGVVSQCALCWRASVASETLTGITQLKIGDVCLLASERSERDTLRGNTIEISLYLFIYLFICLWGT